MTSDDWFSLGRYVELDGHQIFVVDTNDWPGNQAKQSAEKNNTLCILHGFPTSSYDYHKVIETLCESHRVIVHDHLGFGFSDKPLDYSYSLIDQTTVAVNLWKLLGVTSAQILGHDYGTSIVTELLARDNNSESPIVLEKVLLCNGSMHIEMARLRIIQKLLRLKIVGPLVARLSSKRVLARNLRNIGVDSCYLSDAEIDDIWKTMNFNRGKRILAKVSRYTFERQQRWDRWIGALRESDLPIEIIWPDSDPIAIAAMATVIHQETKNSQLHWLKGVGHFPMLEQPKKWCSLVQTCLGQ
jgi:pimeloyl-ACP methyl ester carboxylesterase